jgi:hypothetical protein
LEKLIKEDASAKLMVKQYNPMKLLLVMLILCSCGFLSALELQVGLNYDGMGELKKYDYVGFYPNTKLEDGISPHFQCMLPFRNVKVGIGVEYQMPREIISKKQPTWFVSNDEYKISFIPIYLAIQVPVHDKTIPVEILGELGYCFHQGNQAYRRIWLYPSSSVDPKLKDGYHAGGGIGFYKEPFMISLMLKSEQVDVEYYNGRVTRIDTHHYSLGIEYRLKVTGK